MRYFHAAIVLLLAFVAVSTAWSTEDHEIFRLRDEVIQHEGHNATFYSFIGVKPSATIDDIKKAYRKKSLAIHPDKARQRWLASYDKLPPKQSKSGEKPGVHVHKHKKPSQREITSFNKEASARFSVLGVVANILRGPERERYDHFLRNGFPKWRGTGYYYQRYRPGLGAVLTGLFVFVGGGVHYLALYLGWKKQREFVERYIKHARRMAWGDEGGIGAIPGLGANGAISGTSTPIHQDSDEDPAVQNWNRRERRLRDKEKTKANRNPKAAKAVQKAKDEGISEPKDARLTSGPVGAKKRTVAENGKVLIVDSVGNVFLEEETEEGQTHEFLLDVDEIPPPTIYDTVLFRLPKWTYNQSVGKLLNKRTEDAEIADLVGEEEPDKPEEEALKAAIPANANAEARKRRAKAKAR